MTDKAEPRRAILATDIDPQGMVTIWDHGPREPADAAPGSPELARAEAEAEDWNRRTGGVPVALSMHAQDAGHALERDPGRYALEPLDVDDADVEAEIDAIQERREAERQAAIERADAAQLTLDRKAAIETVMVRRRADAVIERAKPAAYVPPRPAIALPKKSAD